MTPFIANTDKRWFDYLSTRCVDGVVDEVNFWQPNATRPMKRMAPGEPVFFRLKRPDYCIAGYGFFAHFQAVSIEDAWRLFGWRNGDESEMSFIRRIAGYRTDDLSVRANRRKLMGCTILRDAHFWPDNRWMPWRQEQGWAPNIVQGATERDPARAAKLLARIAEDAAQIPQDLIGQFELVEGDHRIQAPATTYQRVGQGTFRARLFDAYGRCAITGEKTMPVLDAAHIQPYRGPQSNHVQNGLLLTKEFHTLFDAGYVTVTPDYQVRVSEALRADWQNGKRYYAYDQQPLAAVPTRPGHAPSRDALAWHGEAVFRG